MYMSIPLRGIPHQAGWPVRSDAVGVTVGVVT